MKKAESSDNRALNAVSSTRFFLGACVLCKQKVKMTIKQSGLGSGCSAKTRGEAHVGRAGVVNQSRAIFAQPAL